MMKSDDPSLTRAIIRFGKTTIVGYNFIIIIYTGAGLTDVWLWCSKFFKDFSDLGVCLQLLLQRMSLPKCTTEHQRIRVSRRAWVLALFRASYSVTLRLISSTASVFKA